MAKRVGLTLVQRAYDALMPNPPGVADFAGVKRIALTLIDPHPEQPRRGELPDLPELADNIRRYGLLQPIVVASPIAGRFQLIAGARRLAAFGYLLDHDGERPSQWADVPAFVRDADTLDRLLMALSENMARRDLSDADTVLAVRTLHDMHAWSATEIAERVGTSVGWISQILGVARDPELADHVQMGRLSVAKAQEIRTAKTSEARGAALAVGLQGGSQPSIRQAKHLATLRYLNPSPGAGDAAGEAPSAPGKPNGLRYLIPPQSAEDGVPLGADDGGVGSGSPPTWERSTAAGPIVLGETRELPAPVVSAAPPAGTRDLADAARELALTGHFVDLQSTALFAVALRSGLATFDIEAMMKTMREDLRRMESLVRTAQSERRADTRPGGRASR